MAFRALCRPQHSAVLQHVQTPACLVDVPVLRRNIVAMQARATANHCALRPHIKTHKCPRIAALQVAAGADGVTCATAKEAVSMLEGGVGAVTIAYPFLHRRALDRLLQYPGRVSFTVDSEEVLARLEGAVSEAQAAHVPVFVKVDVGLRRCGLEEGDSRLGALCGRVHAHARLRLAGVLSHAGHSYSAASVEDIARIAEEERLTMLRVKERITAAIPSLNGELMVSVGSTPTELARKEHTGLDQLRPGNYVFLDRGGLTKGIASPEDIALCVLATVVSRNEKHIIINAGSKALSSDKGAHGTSADGYGLAYAASASFDAFHPDRAWAVVGLSEEHGWLDASSHPSGPEAAVGDRVLVLPNHSCPVVNLADQLVAVDVEGGWRGGGEEEVSVEYWDVACRGSMHGDPHRRESCAVL